MYANISYILINGYFMIFQLFPIYFNMCMTQMLDNVEKILFHCCHHESKIYPVVKLLRL